MSQEGFKQLQGLYEEAGLGKLSIPEKSDAQWVLRRRAKFSLAGYRNHNTYSPLTNTAANASRLAELSPEPVDPEPTGGMAEPSTEPSTAGGGQG